MEILNPGATSFKTFRVIFSLIIREMETTYGRSPGGYLWAILEPVAGIALLSAVFSFAFRSPPIGTNFPIFYATGMLPFTIYMGLNQKITQSVKFSRQLIFYPRVTFVDAIIARFILNALTDLLVLIIIFAGMLLIFKTQTVLNISAILLSFSMAVSLAFGIGCMNCFLVGQFPIWGKIWGILNRPMFIISCIFFIFDSIPEPYRSYLWFNPLIHIVGEMRKGFYPTYDANYVSPMYVFGLSLILTALGLLFLRRYYRDFV